MESFIIVLKEGAQRNLKSASGLRISSVSCELYLKKEGPNPWGLEDEQAVGSHGAFFLQQANNRALRLLC